ncbi:MAG TPA: ABC transporter substrate-binding protein [Bacilli bacterium]|nr:ABC transporter substrate-binding protein [Bacilli bacterium]
MKKRIIISLIIILFLFSMFIICKKINKKEDNLEHIKVAEVTHSVFYAPLYVAIEKGYFQDYGLDIELILTPGADKVSAAVLSDDVEIGFCGPESSIYVYNGKEKDYIQSFAGLTKRDGQFIVSRKNIKNFKMEDLIGKEVLAGRKGGMPVLNFENALINSNIDKNEVNINTSVEFSALSGSFIGGQGDFVNLFEPNATKLEKEGYGYVVGSVGMISGEVPYTAFNAKKSYIKNNKETIKNFNKAINEGLKYVKEHDEKDIANAIINQFPDSSINDVTTIVKRYKESDSWLENTFISEKSFKNLEDIMIKANLIKEYVPYKDLIININNE